MRLRSVTLQNYRNIALARLELTGERQFFSGANGQGKTNLLEAVGMLTALRSFRTADSKLLIAHGQAEAGLAFKIDHEVQGDTTVRITLRGDGKEVCVDQNRVARLGDYLGQFPTVVFSSQDLQLVRGAPGARRRWLDLTLAAMDRSYLLALQTYHRALAERNALLKAGGNMAELAAFEQAMAPAAVALIERRKADLAALGIMLTDSYARIADAPEPVEFLYASDCGEDSPDAFRALMRDNRERDLRMRTTLRGPHRDDFEFIVQGVSAKDFASEGQQRLLVIALRLAQADWFEKRSGVKPILLADDVVGELDPCRRERFWSAIGPEIQVMATSTEVPNGIGAEWRIFRVEKGKFD
ncbi:MAG: DNA replication/repair protein RecF [Opitutaceae bacterium]|jgi:DNA replication and repair protein RecF